GGKDDQPEASARHCTAVSGDDSVLPHLREQGCGCVRSQPVPPGGCSSRRPAGTSPASITGHIAQLTGKGWTGLQKKPSTPPAPRPPSCFGCAASCRPQSSRANSTNGPSS